MKRCILGILMIALILSLSGCSEPAETDCPFYYLRTEETICYGKPDALVAPVNREISVADHTLEYLLQLYLEGPVEEGYLNPIPRGTYLLKAFWEDDILVLILSREFSALEDMSLTLAGACLSATCHDLTGSRKIQVRSGEQIYDFDLNHYTFLDMSTGE